MNNGCNFEKHKSISAEDFNKHEMLGKRDKLDIRELQEKSLDFENLRPQQIIDIKRCETNYSFSRKSKEKSSSQIYTSTSIKFMILFVGVNKLDNIKQKVWIKDLDVLGNKKIPLLIKFKNHIMKSFNEPSMKSFCESRLNMLNGYLNTENIELEESEDMKQKLPFLSGDMRIDNNTMGDQFDFSRENTNILGSILNNGNSLPYTAVKGNDEKPESDAENSNGVKRKQTAVGYHEPYDYEAERSTSYHEGKAKPAEEKDEGKRNSEQESEYKKPRSSKRQPKPTRRNQLLSKPARRKSAKREAKSDIAETKPNHAPTVKEEGPSLVVNENIKELEDRIDYILNIVLVERILQIKKKFLHLDNLETKTAYNEIEKLRETVKSILVDVERRSENVKN